MRASFDFDLYDENDRFASSLTFMNEVDSFKWEPNAASPADRIRAIEMAKERGLVTWASMEPVIDVGQTFELINRVHESVDLFKIGKANYVKGLDIDWSRFANDAMELCEKLGVKYYIKNDLTNLMK